MPPTSTGSRLRPADPPLRPTRASLSEAEGPIFEAFFAEAGVEIWGRIL